MKVQILNSTPTSHEQVNIDGLYNYIRTRSNNGLDVFLVGPGSIDVHVYQDGHWRKHPNGIGITDDGSISRLVIGDNQTRACLVKVDGVTTETSGFLAACGR
jgi:hypothetical protein